MVLFFFFVTTIGVASLNYHIDFSINSYIKLKLFFGVPFNFAFISSYLLFLVVAIIIFNISNIINKY